MSDGAQPEPDFRSLLVCISRGDGGQCEATRIILVLCAERYTMYKEAFGKNFSMLLKERGWSKEQASAIFEVSTSMIYHYMAGSNLPEGAHFARIADILGVSMDFLVGRTTVRDVAKPPKPDNPDSQ